MKTLLALGIGAVLSAAAYTDAQNAVTRRTVQLAGGLIAVEAGRVQVMGNGTTFSNGVIVTANGVASPQIGLWLRSTTLAASSQQTFNWKGTFA